MCGIAGFAGDGSIAVLNAMNDTLVHRGPDDGGVWVDAQTHVYLGHRRLSIVDMTGGHQPMWTRDGALGVVFNGEIYNHLELRKELSALGHVFESDHSDTEVLLHGYRAWGPGLVERLNGMWAFALYDRAQQRLFLSRDRFGKKPLFYTLSQGTFIFASELSAIRAHPLAPSRISPRGIRKFFGYGYIPAPNTILENVFKLPGGHSLTFDLASRRLDIQRYWEFRIEPFEELPRDPEREWGARLIELLSAAVKRRLMSDVPLGFFLSGGVDSSSVTALATRHVAADRINTFSIGFEEASFDESSYAGRVAAALHTRHHPEVLSMQRARLLLPEVVAKLDEPMGDSSLLPTYLLSQHTRQHVTVALGGDGADELFAGYDPFHALAAAEAYRRIVPRPLHAAIRMVMARMPVSHVNMSFDFRVKRALRGLSYAPPYWFPVWMSPLDPKELQDLCGEPVDPEEVYSEAIEHWDSAGHLHIVDKALQFYTRLYLQDDILVKVDRASRAHSLEVRAPYLDIELVDFVRRLPHTFKYRNKRTKYLLKKALEPILPHDILYRPKRGFGVPIGQWFRAGLFEWRDQEPTDLLNDAFLRSKRAEHTEGRSDERAFLWNAWLLREWQSSHRPATVTAPRTIKAQEAVPSGHV